VRWTGLKLAEDKYSGHQELVRSILLWLHENFHGRWWENPTGAVKSESGRFIRFGLLGSTDIVGFTYQGRAVYIEVKTGSGRLSKDQIKFRDLVKKNNCIYIEAREDFKSDPSFDIIPRRAA